MSVVLYWRDCGQVKCVEVPQDATVHDVCCQIAAQGGPAAESQTLVYGGTCLTDPEALLADIGVCPESQIEVVMLLHGPPPQLLASGPRHVLAVQDGSVTCIGDVGRHFGVPDFGGRKAVGVAASKHSLVVLEGGGLAAWGIDHCGQATVPAAVEGRTVVRAAAGQSTSLVLFADGTVYRWGFTSTPLMIQGTAQVQSIGRVSDIAALPFNVFLLLDERGGLWYLEGDAVCPVQGGFLSETVNQRLVAVKGGHKRGAVLTELGRIVCWNGDMDTASEPAGGRRAVAIDAGDDVWGAVFADGTAAEWADGVGTPPPPQHRGAVAICCRGFRSALQTDDGGLLFWPPLPGGAQTASASARAPQTPLPQSSACCSVQ